MTTKPDTTTPAPAPEHDENVYTLTVRLPKSPIKQSLGPLLKQLLRRLNIKCIAFRPGGGA